MATQTSILDDLIPEEKREHIYTRKDFPTIFGNERKKYWEVWDGIIDIINLLDDNDDRKQRNIAIMYEHEMELHRLKLERELVEKADDLRKTKQELSKAPYPLDILRVILKIGIACEIILIIIACIKGVL